MSLLLAASFTYAFGNIEIDDGGTTTENSNLDTVSGNIIVKSNSTYILNGNITNLTGNIEVEAGSTLIINGDIDEVGGSLIIDGDLTVAGSVTASGKLEVKGSGQTTLDGGSFTSTGSDVVIESGGTLNLENQSTISVPGGNEVQNSGTINADNSGNTIDGSVSGSGTVDADLGDCSSGCNDSALPITLIYFKAQSHQESIRLTWATAAEINNDYFTIERSYDGKTFDPIAYIAGAGDSEEQIAYEYADRPLGLGLIYYRLTQTDFDGKFERFPLASVRHVPTGSDQLEVYPTLLTPGDPITIEGGWGRTELVVLRATDMRGVSLSVTALGETPGALTIPTAHIPAGTYVLRGHVNGFRVSQRIVIKN